jgi:hypothetical protein
VRISEIDTLAGQHTVELGNSSTPFNMISACFAGLVHSALHDKQFLKGSEKRVKEPLSKERTQAEGAPAFQSKEGQKQCVIATRPSSV